MPSSTRLVLTITVLMLCASTRTTSLSCTTTRGITRGRALSTPGSVHSLSCAPPPLLTTLSSVFRRWLSEAALWLVPRNAPSPLQCARIWGGCSGPRRHHRCPSASKRRPTRLPLSALVSFPLRWGLLCLPRFPPGKWHHYRCPPYQALTCHRVLAPEATRTLRCLPSRPHRRRPRHELDRKSVV